MIDSKNPKKSLKIFDEIYEKISTSGLLEKLKEIRMVVCGKDDEEFFLDSNYKKCKIIKRVDSYHDYEFPTLIKLKNDCDLIEENEPILYLHLKGLTSNSSKWRKNMLDVVVDKHDECISFLNEFNAVGTMLSEPYVRKEKIPRHFSGNFWWTTTDHIKKLPHPIDLEKDYLFLVEGRSNRRSLTGITLNPIRYLAEFWIGLFDMEKDFHKLKEIK